MQATAVASPIECAVLESARVCAALRAIEDEVGDGRLFIDDYARHFAGDVAIRKARERRQAGRSRIAIRTKWFDDYIHGQFARRTITQLVLLGAGFDARAFRLQSLNSVTVFEIDAASVLDAKRDALLRIHPAPRLLARDVRSVSADLSRDDWGTRLQQAGFDSAVCSVWVIEGVLYYLDDDAISRTFRTIAALSANGSQIAFSAITRPSTATRGLAAYFKSSISDPFAFLKRFSFAVDTVDVFGGPRANFGRCLPKDIRREDDWKHGKATIYVAATKV